MRRKKSKLNKYIIVSLILIFLLFIFLLKRLDKTKNQILLFTSKRIEKQINNNVKESINKVAKEKNFNEIIKIYKTDDNIIQYVDYDLDEIYKLYNFVSTYLDKNSYTNEIKVPIGVLFNTFLFYNFGPKFILKIICDDYFNLYIDTKINNYGINNALLSTYLNISFKYRIILPFDNEEFEYNYAFLINSKVINGVVPSYYGGNLNEKSSIINVPFK